MFAELIEGLVKFCEQEDTQTLLEHKLLDPMVQFLSKRYRWCVNALQLVLALAILQTVLLGFLTCVALRP